MCRSQQEAHEHLSVIEEEHAQMEERQAVLEEERALMVREQISKTHIDKTLEIENLKRGREEVSERAEAQARTVLRSTSGSGGLAGCVE